MLRDTHSNPVVQRCRAVIAVETSVFSGHGLRWLVENGQAAQPVCFSSIMGTHLGVKEWAVVCDPGTVSACPCRGDETSCNMDDSAVFIADFCQLLVRGGGVIKQFL